VVLELEANLIFFYLLCTGGGGGNSSTPKNKAKATNAEFGVEYAKSSRSECVACEEKIENAEIRISKLDHMSESAMMVGKAIVSYPDDYQIISLL
jgi:hypothetical protein